MALNVSKSRLESSGLLFGAASEPRLQVQAQAPSSATQDWRVSLAVPDVIQGGPVLSPLANTNSRMIFPFTPTIVYSHTANYNALSPTHTNYQFYAYQNSQIDQIQITGEFFSENETDAQYWLACVHFLRTMTKMFYGSGTDVGNPPPLSRLNGYGKHVLNNIPVLITQFTVDLPADVDYIPCSIENTNPNRTGTSSTEINYVPTQSTITVSVVPNYARASQSQFNLKSFANGEFVGDEKGFI